MNNPKKYTVATRGSQLALTQTRQTMEKLQQKNPGLEFELKIISTKGDRVTDRPLSQFRGIGVFVKELENALLAGEADLAIHSLKDVPSDQPADLVLACFPIREDTADVLITRDRAPLESLPQGALCGTSSPRRQIQLRAIRPDLRFTDLRGNLDTRIRKLQEGQCDAIMLAAAGLNRLGLSLEQIFPLPVSRFLPAVGQGALALECRKNDADLLSVVRSINDPDTEREVSAERWFMRELGVGCSAPVAALARTENGRLHLEAMVGDLETGKVVRASQAGALDSGKEMGISLARELKNMAQIAAIPI
jgi:hydroxymethylbilane synthase